MAYELVYTSAPRGIKPGSSGFCIVAYTNGLAANIAMQLENLSAYKPYFPHYDVNAEKNPVAYSHYMYASSGENFHILSRVCFCGLDYTKRSNKLAHHLVLTSDDLRHASSGPFSVFMQEGVFWSQWAGEPQLFPQQKNIDAPSVSIHKAETWAAYAGDAGWAGVLAQRYLDSPEKPAFIIYDPLMHTEIFSLVEEALLLLPQEKRWDVTFNTYFNTLPAGIRCAWRFCVPGSDALREARRTPGALVIDLTKTLPAASAGVLQDAARTGVIPQEKNDGAALSHSPRLTLSSDKQQNQRALSQNSNVRRVSVSQIQSGNSRLFRKIAIIATLLSVLIACGVFAGIAVLNKKQAKENEKKLVAERAEKEQKAKAEAEKARQMEDIKKKEEEDAKIRAAAEAKKEQEKKAKAEKAKAEQEKKTKAAEAKRALDKRTSARQTLWANSDWILFCSDDKVKEVTLKNLLAPDEKIVKITLQNSDQKKETIGLKKDGVFEKENETRGISKMSNKFEFSYDYDNETLNIKNDKKLSDYKIFSLETSNGGKIFGEFCLGESRIPRKNSSIEIFERNKKFYLLYKCSDLSKIKGKVDLGKITFSNGTLQKYCVITKVADKEDEFELRLKMTDDFVKKYLTLFAWNYFNDKDKTDILNYHAKNLKEKERLQKERKRLETELSEIGKIEKKSQENLDKEKSLKAELGKVEAEFGKKKTLTKVANGDALFEKQSFAYCVKPVETEFLKVFPGRKDDLKNIGNFSGKKDDQKNNEQQDGSDDKVLEVLKKEILTKLRGAGKVEVKYDGKVIQEIRIIQKGEVK